MEQDGPPLALDRDLQLSVQIGFDSNIGRRSENQDYVGCFLGTETTRRRFGVIAALADGVGGAKGSRVAAELAVRSFIDGVLGSNGLLNQRHVAGTAIEAINRWIHAKSETDADLAHMASTLTAAILHGRQIHVVHVGDSRLYRLRDAKLERLTEDHSYNLPGMQNVLRRAIGADDGVQIDYVLDALKVHDRILLCSDGIHGVLSDRVIEREMLRRMNSEETAQALTSAALTEGSTDNVTALVIDILSLPAARQQDLELSLGRKPIRPAPEVGAVVDGFRLDTVLSDGRYSRVFAARDLVEDRDVVAKFPKPVAGAGELLHQAFLREHWIATRVSSPWLGEVIQIAESRQSALYSIQPRYHGETLEAKLQRHPPLSSSEGLAISGQLIRAIAALHRAGIIHRDIKPDNIIVLDKRPGESGLISIRLIDLGVARIPDVDDFAPEHAPGTPSFMAPELFSGATGDELSDQFAAGVTIYRLFSGAYPYGEIEPFSRPRFGQAKSLSHYRADLPAWLIHAVHRSISVAPRERFGDALEFAFALEHGALLAPSLTDGPKPLYARNPLLFWQITTALLAIALAISLVFPQSGTSRIDWKPVRGTQTPAPTK